MKTNTKNQIIAFASDHAGFDLKDKLSKKLISEGYQIVDLGPDSGSTSVSYADYGFKLAHYLKENPDAKGIGICGTGLGISYALNRFSFIRAARVSSVDDAKLAKLHNDANVLAFGGRQITLENAFEMFKKWESTEFEGGRHIQRIETLNTEGSDQ
ncbi:RpiB/LacA/LacB family sugar-phosphate isomerase [Mycoplasma miroungirhinis]|uniref:RpiB/LacA/LacB family sugar-phosphate isomerase n=1 Tax=Mycoplasma miroungirhinis TaxID=754516 RepID=A0A6M4JBX9_9MOLU|nr:RpiB/LacA/LacB family sugar-phosphate isomerase [Mycoplasma miroungirhinis]QJR44420.1 RpiB/LacA/LacB family sugar-phosphate isomerase [Mycoplasma miroungirhinis]